MEEFLFVGVCLKPQGVRGEIKVKPESADPKRFGGLKSIIVEQRGEKKEYKVTSARGDGAFAYLALEGINDMDAAEKLRDAKLWVPRKDGAKLPEGSYYTADIIGCAVFTVDGEELGKVTEIYETGRNDVYEIAYKGRKILLPAIKQVVKSVDVEAAKITVDISTVRSLVDEG